MAFLRQGSPNYQIRRRNLLGYGDTGQLSSGTSNRKVADRMELALEELAERALIEPKYVQLLDALCRDKVISPAELLAARNGRRLDGLLRSLDDPKLTAVIDEYMQTKPGRITRIGLEQLRTYAPDGARFSYIMDPIRITELCQKAERAPDENYTRNRNTVVRCFKRTVSKMLRWRLGNAERNRIFADVQYEGRDDTREVHLTPQDIHRLLTAAHDFGYHELAVVIRTALLTSADRGVLLSGPAHHGRVRRGLLVQDVSIYQNGDAYRGEIHLLDSKAKNRSRTVSVGHELAHDLLLLARTKGPNDPVFSIQYQDLDYVWKRTREAAGLEHVRFKDLRAQMSQYGEEAGIPLTILQRAMGHSNERMTRKYQKRQVLFTPEHAEKVAAAMGM